MKKLDLFNIIDSLSGRSAWRLGVIGYAYEKIDERRPNASEEWLDTQARALFQAAKIVKNMYEF